MPRLKYAIVLLLLISICSMGAWISLHPTSTSAISNTTNNSLAVYTLGAPAISEQVTPTLPQTPMYVECSDYHKIMDKWRTPDNSYVKLDDGSIVTLFIPSGGFWMSKEANPEYGYSDNYFNLTVGQYIKICQETDEYICMARLGSSVRLKHVTEAESGYRDACEVIK